jgi:16S rRNA (guanine966-N2)-methyltransferase
MRVIAGKYRGRTLKGPKHQGVRPTADRVKEALFNIIGAGIDDANFLDLFAGTGAVGIEALSRGAKSVVFADENYLSIKLLNENVKILASSDQYRVYHLNAEQTLELLAKENSCFDLIFLDPPFKAGLVQQTIQLIVDYGLLKSGGLLVVEHPRALEITHGELKNFRDRRYGDISLTFLQR